MKLLYPPNTILVKLNTNLIYIYIGISEVQGVKYHQVSSPDRKSGSFLTNEEAKYFNLVPITANSMWLVHYECRTEVIRVSALINIKEVKQAYTEDKKTEIFGFFAPGQEALWALSAVTRWIREIKE